MTSTSPQALKGVDARGQPLQGLKNGMVTELSMLLKVKPGHEKQIRDAIYAFCNDPARDPSSPQAMRAAAKIGVHEVRHVLFDNDTRLLWMTSFDSDWDSYIDDTIAIVGVPLYGTILKHCVGVQDDLDVPGAVTNASAFVKDMFNSVRVTGAGLLVTMADVSITEQLRNRQVRQAFDAALNNPDAAKALAHPALKPLLELAAD